jgi:hypothetical protein
MATTRDLMNKVLRGIRQFGVIIDDTTTSTTDDYLLLILQFVNEAKEEIEESGWSWRALRKTITVTLAAGTVEYDLTIAGTADVDTNDRSRLLYENVNMFGSSESAYTSSTSAPQVFDVTDSQEYRLKEWTQEKMERAHFTDDDDTAARPTHFCWYSDGDSIRIKVYPTPSEARTFKIRMYVPQTELTADDLDTVLSIPQRPVWTLALFKANQERGEELGKEGSAAQRAYLDAHGAAVGIEMTPADQTVNLER